MTPPPGFLWTPMSHFYEDDASIHALRLSCSSVTPAQIDTALNRLTALIWDQLVLSVEANSTVGLLA
jgi:(S)-3,5-dihydroxyphenylglycine transaminase